MPTNEMPKRTNILCPKCQKAYLEAVKAIHRISSHNPDLVDKQKKEIALKALRVCKGHTYGYLLNYSPLTLVDLLVALGATILAADMLPLSFWGLAIVIFLTYVGLFIVSLRFPSKNIFYGPLSFYYWLTRASSLRSLLDSTVEVNEEDIQLDSQMKNLSTCRQEIETRYQLIVFRLNHLKEKVRKQSGKTLEALMALNRSKVSEELKEKLDKSLEEQYQKLKDSEREIDDEISLVLKDREERQTHLTDLGAIHEAFRAASLVEDNHILLQEVQFRLQETRDAIKSLESHAAQLALNTSSRTSALLEVHNITQEVIGA